MKSYQILPEIFFAKFRCLDERHTRNSWIYDLQNFGSKSSPLEMPTSFTMAFFNSEVALPSKSEVFFRRLKIRLNWIHYYRSSKNPRVISITCNCGKSFSPCSIILVQLLCTKKRLSRYYQSRKLNTILNKSRSNTLSLKNDGLKK